jgi:hypothetical protein
VTRQPAAGPGRVGGTSASLPRRVGAQTKSVLDVLTLLFRGGGAVLIGVAAFGYSAASGRDLVIEVVAFAIGAVMVAYWLAADLRLEHRHRRTGRGACCPGRYAPQPASRTCQLRRCRAAAAIAARGDRCLIRTAQEALVNTAKHAPAQPVDIGLRYGQDGVQMIISNPLPPRQPQQPRPRNRIRYR